ncbi:MAG: hypothetical protein GY729_07020 [Desulfobacteraceae bacterium]|nr:hypothetical protein [Desulfobacteraceae bacterium]
MSTLKELSASEMQVNQFNLDAHAVPIDWDNTQLVALVCDVESEGNQDFETGIERKKVFIMQDAVNVRPAWGDEVYLNFDPSKMNRGDYWTIDRVAEPSGMYEIHFYRNVSL